MASAPAKQVDAPRCPKCGSTNIEIWDKSQGRENVVICANSDCRMDWTLYGLAALAQFFRAASLKQETQPPKHLAGCGFEHRLDIEDCPTCSPNSHSDAPTCDCYHDGILHTHVLPGSHVASSPLETPAACLNNSPSHMPEYISGNTYCSVCKIWLWAGPIPQAVTPAPADTGARFPKIIVDPGMPADQIDVIDANGRRPLITNLASTGDTPQPQDAHDATIIVDHIVGMVADDGSITDYARSLAIDYVESALSGSAALGKTPAALPDQLLEAYRQKRKVDGGGSDLGGIPNRVYDSAKHYKWDKEIERLEKLATPDAGEEKEK